ncbi:DUF4132 domain-containing protein [Leptolyngbya boryana CZ1]|uniref:DUF4132 domain-containing protein n=1 Tax=Leptolyngbya boryana CZ1 TaxID=3060204 RepID=A0AA96WV87_LEPBY|nr:DUF4132 domain-containing protein [Leptolyngbya boryana]WNZ45753.1 DUF4132 domain-containing protein [Leptolyngbya boryana CZ1]
MMLNESFDACGTHQCDRHPLIDLDPADWCWATWRKRPQLIRPEPQSFDREVAIAKLKKVKRLKSRHWQWEACEIPVSMSIEEAFFWYEAITKAHHFDRVRDLVKRFETERFETEHLAAPVEIAEIQEWFTLVESNYAPAQMTFILSYFLSIEQLLDKLTEHRQYQLFVGFRQHILPYLNETEFAAIKTYIRANWEPQRFYFRPHLSALLGIHDWLETLVAKWKPERSYAAFDRNFRLEVIFGLESADLVVHHVRRLRLRLGTAEQVRAWLAHTELTALELVTESIAALNSNKEVSNAAEMFDVLTLIRSPIVAPQILALVQRSRIRDRAQQWLEENLELSIAGLLPLTIQKHPLRETAIAWLRMMQRQGFGDLIREKMSDEYQQIELQIFDAPQREELGKTPKWFKAIVDAAPKLEPLDWVKVSDLPAIVVGDTRLSTTHHQAILNLLQADPDNCSSILRQHTNADSLSQFVWQLYEQWSLKKPKGRADWVILALGRLGDDEILLKLADLIRAWCKASKHQLATSGIAALTLRASETAIYQLMQFAYPPISRLIRPEQALDEIAKARNLSRRQLEDCAMREVLERHCTTIANSGSPCKRRPKTHQTQLSKTQLKQFLTLQSLRFEQQMIHRVAYTVAEFQSFVFHPIVRPMAQSLIWQAKSMCFRIAEDGTLADSSDMPVELSSEAEIYLPHPLEMPDRSTWAELLSDYELIPPFAQVNRPIYSVSTQEQDATIVTRFADRGVFTVNLTQSLMKLGWTETYIGRGHWRGYCKRFRADHTAAILSVSEMPREHGYQRIDRIFFVANDWDGRRVPTEGDRIPLTTVAPLVFSEVLREIDHLTHRSKKRHA